eukprot:6683009-Prymnesium_polylepis.1
MSDCTRVPPRAWTLDRKSRKTTETAAPIENSLSLSKLRVVWRQFDSPEFPIPGNVELCLVLERS